MNKECHTLAADPTSASYIGMSFLLTMIKQAVVAIYTLQSVTELQLINKNIVHHDALYTQHPKKKKIHPHCGIMHINMWSFST